MRSSDQRSVVPRRFFACQTCGHRLRFGAAQCGSCWSPTPVTNRRWFYWVIGVATAIVVLFGTVAILLP